jgi:hypothetical protein
MLKHCPICNKSKLTVSFFSCPLLKKIRILYWRGHNNQGDLTMKKLLTISVLASAIAFTTMATAAPANQHGNGNGGNAVLWTKANSQGTFVTAKMQSIVLSAINDQRGVNVDQAQVVLANAYSANQGASALNLYIAQAARDAKVKKNALPINLVSSNKSKLVIHYVNSHKQALQTVILFSKKNSQLDFSTTALQGKAAQTLLGNFNNLVKRGDIIEKKGLFIAKSASAEGKPSKVLINNVIDSINNNRDFSLKKVKLSLNGNVKAAAIYSSMQEAKVQQAASMKVKSSALPFDISQPNNNTIQTLFIATNGDVRQGRATFDNKQIVVVYKKANQKDAERLLALSQKLQDNDKLTPIKKR